MKVGEFLEKCNQSGSTAKAEFLNADISTVVYIIVFLFVVFFIWMMKSNNDDENYYDGY